MFGIIWIALSIAFAKSEAPQLICNHPQVCNLARELISDRSVTLELFEEIQGDPHQYDPSPKTVKRLLSAQTLLCAPNELTPWARNIVWKRKAKNKTTIVLKLPKGIESEKREALSHFWLAPDILCQLSQQLKRELQAQGIGVLNGPCKGQALQKQLTDLSAKFKGKTLVISHDALLPTLTKSGFEVMALKTSHHHDEISSVTVKRFIRLVQNNKAVMILERAIELPPLVKQEVSKIPNFELDTLGSYPGKTTATLDSLITHLERLP